MINLEIDAHCLVEVTHMNLFSIDLFEIKKTEMLMDSTKQLDDKSIQEKCVWSKVQQTTFPIAARHNSFFHQHADYFLPFLECAFASLKLNLSWCLKSWMLKLELSFSHFRRVKLSSESRLSAGNGKIESECVFASSIRSHFPFIWFRSSRPEGILLDVELL